MAFLTNTFLIEADIKQKKHIGKPVITANDTSTFIVSVQDNGVPMNMSKVTKAVLVNLCPDRQVFETVGVIQGDDKVVFDLPAEATAVAGTVRATVQLHGNDERVSTISFNYEVAKDLRMLHNPTAREKMLIEVALQDGPLYIEQAKVAAEKAEKVATENKTRWLPAVDTVALRNSTYPNPAHGDTVRVTSEGRIYRSETGRGWILTDQYNPAAIDQVTAQLAEKAAKSEVQSLVTNKAEKTYVDSVASAKRDKTVPIGLNDASPELLGAIEGGAGTTFNLLSVPRVGSVTPETTTFLKAGKNLFNKATVTVNFLVDSISGNLTASASYTATDFIPILPNTNYAVSHKRGIAFYDANKVFISGVATASGGTADQPYTFTTPTNAYYMRSSILNANVGVFQLELGTQSTAYENFAIGLASDIMYTVTPEKMAQSTYDTINTKVKSGLDTETLKTKLQAQQLNELVGARNGTKVWMDRANTTATYLDNTGNTALTKSHAPKILRIGGTGVTSGSVILGHLLENISNTTGFVAGIWLNKADILNLESKGIYLQPSLSFLGATPTNGATLDSTGKVLFSFIGLTRVGYEASGIVGGGAKYTFKTKAELNGYVYVEFRVYDYPNSPTGVNVYFPRFSPTPAGLTFKVDTLGYTILKNADTVSPAIVYPESADGIQDLESAIDAIEELQTGALTSKWSGKVWHVFGDSNSNNPYVSKMYHGVIADEINCQVTNYALGGAGYVAKGDTGTIKTVLEQATDAGTNADLVTVMAGGNDYAKNIPLGAMGDTSPATFYGALDTTFNFLIDKYMTKTLAVFTQTRRGSDPAPNSAGVTVEQQVYATIEICKKYSIPVLDLYHHGNVYAWKQSFRDVFMQDTVHFNDAGQAKIASKIRSFIESL